MCTFNITKGSPYQPWSPLYDVLHCCRMCFVPSQCLVCGIAATLSCINWVEERDEMMLPFSFIHNVVQLWEGMALERASFSLSSLRFLNVSVKALWGQMWVFPSWLWDKLVIIWIYRVFIDDRVLLISSWHFWPNTSSGLSFLSKHLCYSSIKHSSLHGSCCPCALFFSSTSLGKELPYSFCLCWNCVSS